MVGEIETAAALASSALTCSGATETYRHRGSSRGLCPPWKESVITLLVKSKTRRNALLYKTFEGQRECGHALGDTHSHGVGDGPPRLNQQSRDLLYLSEEFSRLAQAHCLIGIGRSLAAP